jgi:hypothetical protein
MLLECLLENSLLVGSCCVILFLLILLGQRDQVNCTTKSVIDIQRNKNRSITVDGKEYHNVHRIIIETKEERIDLETVYTNLTIQITGDHNGELSLNNGHVIVSGNSEDVRTISGIVEIGNSCSRITTHNGPVTVKGQCHGEINTVSGKVTVNQD